MKSILLIMIASGIAASAHAHQSVTVGELLSKGAKKLTKEELTSIYGAGVTISALSPGGTRKFEITYAKDGTLSGRSTDEIGQRGYGLHGTWSVNDEAQVCTKIRNTYGRDVTPNPPCGARFKLGDLLYSAHSEAPDSPARLLSISK